MALRDTSLPKVKVNSLVILSIMNFYMRRSANGTRIMGTLVGEIAKDGSIIVRTR
ncbi:hypothetical protein EON64_07260 [archaeon]|nr:MAG: hypothetical protein EON64_07260 [archaeon]